MDRLKKNNPVYSKTDSSQVNLSEEEWKKIPMTLIRNKKLIKIAPTVRGWW